MFQATRSPPTNFAVFTPFVPILSPFCCPHCLAPYVTRLPAGSFVLEFGGYGRGTEPIKFRDVAGLLVDEARRRLLVCDQVQY